MRAEPESAVEDERVGLVTERFDARERSAKFHRAIGEDAFPPWLVHADPASDVWWARVRSWFREFQVVLVDDGQPVIAGWAVPIAWDVTGGLPPPRKTDSSANR